MFVEFVQLSGIKFCKLGDKNPQISEEEERRSYKSMHSATFYYAKDCGFNWNQFNNTKDTMKSTTEYYLPAQQEFKHLMSEFLQQLVVFIIITSENQVCEMK